MAFIAHEKTQLGQQACTMFRCQTVGQRCNNLFQPGRLTSRVPCLILIQMVKYKNVIQSDALNAVFAALADPTRRQVLQTLEAGGSSAGELAAPHGMSLPGFMKHLRVLEGAGLVSREKNGRVVSLLISPEPLQEAAVWLSRYQKFWSPRLDALGRYLETQEEVSPWNNPVPTASLKASPPSSSPATTKPHPKKSGAPGPTHKR
jgi:DNA-binding transcriptional ArsR family regulator